MPIEPCYAERHSPPLDPASPLLRADGRGIQLGCHTVRSHGLKLLRRHVYDWLILSFLMVLVAILNVSRPFYRFVGKEMMADIKYPHQSNTVPSWAVPVISIILPLMVIIPFYYYKKDVYDLHHAILGVLFSVLITGVITNAIKNAVGRPRPDFFWRCFPDGNALYDPVTGNVICHGKEYLINDGHKSFPSGHTSWSFAGLGFLSLYLSAKIRAFDQRGHVAKLCIVLLPLFIACLVGISRVDDYRHHWQDVFAGGLLGLMVATFCYRQFFPAPYHNSGWQTYAYQRALTESGNAHIDSAERPSEAATSVGSPRPQHTQITEEELESQRTSCTCLSHY